MELRSQSFGFCVFVNTYPVYVVVHYINSLCEMNHGPHDQIKQATSSPRFSRRNAPGTRLLNRVEK